MRTHAHRCTCTCTQAHGCTHMHTSTQTHAHTRTRADCAQRAGSAPAGGSSADETQRPSWTGAPARHSATQPVCGAPTPYVTVGNAVMKHSGRKGLRALCWWFCLFCRQASETRAMRQLALGSDRPHGAATKQTLPRDSASESDSGPARDPAPACPRAAPWA